MSSTWKEMSQITLEGNVDVYMCVDLKNQAVQREREISTFYDMVHFIYLLF